MLYSLLLLVCSTSVFVSVFRSESGVLSLSSALAPQSGHKVCDAADCSSMKEHTVFVQAEGALHYRSPPPVGRGAKHLTTEQWTEQEEGRSVMDRLLRKCRIRNQLLRQCLAEGLGVYVMMVSV